MIKPLLPDAHWGKVGPLDEEEDWQKVKDIDPDDEELPKTPPDVVAMLGFDPLELDWTDLE